MSISNRSNKLTLDMAWCMKMLYVNVVLMWSCYILWIAFEWKSVYYEKFDYEIFFPYCFWAMISSFKEEFRSESLWSSGMLGDGDILLAYTHSLHQEPVARCTLDYTTRVTPGVVYTLGYIKQPAPGTGMSFILYGITHLLSLIWRTLESGQRL